ncbi:MAG: DsbA family protein [Acidimicrobiales bacterium]
MPVIEVFADVVCPFTHVGLRALAARRAELGRPDVRLHVRAWPLELVNGRAVDPAFIGHEVADLRRQVAAELFAGFDERSFPASSLPALALTNAAYAVSAERGEAVALDLRDALFERGLDVGSPAVLRELAGAHGLSMPDVTDSVRRDYDEGCRRGVRGSPHFFLPGGQDAFCPSLDITREEAGLRIAFDRRGFDELVQACFAT